jgi:hypothetical protein
MSRLVLEITILVLQPLKKFGVLDRPAAMIGDFHFYKAAYCVGRKWKIIRKQGR